MMYGHFYMMDNTAILVLDLINDIVNEKSKFAMAAKCVTKNKVIQQANKIIHYGRKNGLLLVFVKVGFSENYHECPTRVNTSLFHKVKALQAYKLGTWGTEFHPDLDVLSSDTVVIKHRISAFYATDLEAILRAQCISHLILFGVSADLVVQTTARDAHDRDYKVTVITDACAADNEQTSQEVFNHLGKIATLVTADNFLSNT